MSSLINHYCSSNLPELGILIILFVYGSFRYISDYCTKGFFSKLSFSVILNEGRIFLLFVGAGIEFSAAFWRLYGVTCYSVSLWATIPAGIVLGLAILTISTACEFTIPLAQRIILAAPTFRMAFVSAILAYCL